MQLSEEKLNANYLLFINYLQKYRCYSDTMMSDIGEKIKRASYSFEEQYGGCYDGSLIDVTLNVLCKIGYTLNENVFGHNGNGQVCDNIMYVNPNSLMRVLLLLNIGKAIMFIPQNDEWFRKKGKLYKFDDNSQTNMKLGQRTLFMCQKYGLTLNEDEYCAIASVDKEGENDGRYHTPLYAIASAAKNLTMIKLREEYLASKKKENIEL